MPFVLDNSIVTAWYFADQAARYSDAVLKLISRDMAHTPSLWPLEFSNVLRKFIHLKKISGARAREIITQNQRWLGQGVIVSVTLCDWMISVGS